MFDLIIIHLGRRVFKSFFAKRIKLVVRKSNVHPEDNIKSNVHPEDNIKSNVNPEDNIKSFIRRRLYRGKKHTDGFKVLLFPPTESDRKINKINYVLETLHEQLLSISI